MHLRKFQIFSLEKNNSKSHQSSVLDYSSIKQR